MLSLGRVTGHAIASAQSWCLLKRVENTSKRRCSYARHSLCCGPRSSEATCTEKLSDRWVNKCRAPDLMLQASGQPACQSLPVRAGVDRLHHVVTCRRLALFSQTRHQARTQPSLSLSGLITRVLLTCRCALDVDQPQLWRPIPLLL